MVSKFFVGFVAIQMLVSQVIMQVCAMKKIRKHDNEKLGLIFTIY